MPSKLKDRGAICVSMTWRATSARAWHCLHRRPAARHRHQRVHRHRRFRVVQRRAAGAAFLQAHRLQAGLKHAPDFVKRLPLGQEHVQLVKVATRPPAAGAAAAIAAAAATAAAVAAVAAAAVVAAAAAVTVVPFTRAWQIFLATSSNAPCFELLFRALDGTP